jgi:serine/threonine protein kinase
MSSEVPEMIGKYKVLSLVAQGGMGAVYKAVHPSLKRNVVIKKLTARGSTIARERFKKEAQILLDMQSPFIVHVFDYFTEGPYRYIVEEFVDGMAFNDIIKKEVVIEPLVALLVLQDVCCALKFAHAKGIVHRDMKPGNILVSRKAEVKLADFGIASDEEDKQDAITQNGVMLGTPAYMSPEQIKNSATVDARADIYSLGVMLYEMVTGGKPYASDLSEENLAKIRKGKYTSPKKINKDLPSVLCKLIKKMMQPKASRRYKSVTPILKIVKKYLSNYDAHAIRIQLARMVISPKAVKKIEFKKKVNFWKIVSACIASAVIVLVAANYLWTQGYIHQTLLRHWYTPVYITMKMPEAAAPASDNESRAIFFEVGEKRITAVPESDRVFFQGEVPTKKLTISRLGTKSKNYVIKPVYLKPGSYRAKVVFGSYVWWQSFQVGKEDKILGINLLNSESRNITLKTSAVDSSTLEDISEKTKFTVLYNDRWIDLEKLPMDKFKSATVWKFKASCEGYESEIFSLLIDWYQDNVSIAADLVPVKK